MTLKDYIKEVEECAREYELAACSSDNDEKHKEHFERNFNWWDGLHSCLLGFQSLQKAYSRMAVKYCEHTRCCFCEVNDKCVEYRGTIRGSEHLMEYFLKEGEENGT